MLATLIQGTFAVFLRYMAPLKWENFWGIYSLVALLIGPVLLAFLVNPNFFQVLTSIPSENLRYPILFGALWGVGSILFGLSAVRIGLSLTYSIILGMTTLIGTLLPPLINKIIPSGLTLNLLVFGLILITLGVIVSGYAGVLRDQRNKKIKRDIIIGLALAFFSGLFSPLLNVAFITGASIAAISKNNGVAPEYATFLVWAVVLFGGFVVNFGYVLFLLIKNKTFSLYSKMSRSNFLAALASALFWLISSLMFGISTVKIGKLGPSIAWAIFISFSIVISNLWGIRFGEWTGAKRALKYQIKSIILISIGVGFIAYSALIS